MSLRTAAISDQTDAFWVLVVEHFCTTRCVARFLRNR